MFVYGDGDFHPAQGVEKALGRGQQGFLIARPITYGLALPAPPLLHEGGSNGNPPLGPAHGRALELPLHGPEAGPQALEPQTHLLCPAATRRRRTTM